MKKFINKLIVISLILTFSMTLTSCTKEIIDSKSIFSNFLEGNEIADIVYYKGMIYVGGRDGVFKINPDNFENEKVNLGEIFLVKDLLIYNDKLYIGHDGGITVFDGENYTNILDKNTNVPDYRVNTMMFDNDGSLWVGTFEGALKYTDSRWESLTTENGLSFKIVYLIMEDEYGGILFGHYGSVNEAISYLKDGRWSYFTVKEGLPHNYIVTGLKYKNKIYLTTGFYDIGGLAIFDTTAEGIKLEKTIIREWGENGSKTRSINIENDILWIGTEYNGLCIMKNDDFIKFDVNDGLISNEVKAIYFDGLDRAWLGTKNGLSIVSKSDIYSKLN